MACIGAVSHPYTRMLLEGRHNVLLGETKRLVKGHSLTGSALCRSSAWHVNPASRIEPLSKNNLHHRQTQPEHNPVQHQRPARLVHSPCSASGWSYCEIWYPLGRSG